MLNTTDQTPAAQQNCPYCAKPIEKPVQANIIRREYVAAKRRVAVVSKPMDFCSGSCAGKYQMGCEG